ncbi:hypothetical protein JOM56_013218 [Amanita muscaria]
MPPRILLPLPTSVENKLISTNGGASTFVNFINELGVDARISWIDSSGKHIFYATVKPGETYRQQTYVGHPWEVTTNDGFKADFMPLAPESIAVLEYPTLDALPTAAIGNLISTKGGNFASVDFINRLSVDVNLFRIDENGSRVFIRTLKPSAKFRWQGPVNGNSTVLLAVHGSTAAYLPSTTPTQVSLQIPTLRPLPREANDNVRSVNGTATAVNFINKLDVEAKVYWINYEGNRVLYATLQPGDSTRQQTFVGHPWEVVAAPDFRKVYLPTVAESSAILESLKSGTKYNIVNIEGDTYMSLSSTDQVIGNHSDGTYNQDWLVESVGNGNWVVKSQVPGKNLYLGVGPAGPQQGAPLNGVADRVEWLIREEGPSGWYRITVPGSATRLTADLKDGSTLDDTPVILNGRLTCEHKNQIWRFIETSGKCACALLALSLWCGQISPLSL